MYFVGRSSEADSVLGLAKLKTIEYRIFRKIREKLRNFWSLRSNIDDLHNRSDRLNESYDRKFNGFKKELS